MASDPLFSPLLLVALVLICLLIHVGWPDGLPRAFKMSLEPHKGRRTRSTEPKSFSGFLHKPLCEACEQGADTRPKAPDSPLRSSPASEDAGAPSTRIPTFVQRRSVPTTAGLDAATSAPMGIPAASPGGSYSVSPAMGISLRPMARSFMASAPRQLASYASLHVWPKAWASGAQHRSSKSTPTRSSRGWEKPRLH
jgi:hypothetical protein